MEYKYNLTEDSVLKHKETNIWYPVLKLHEDGSVDVLGDNTQTLTISPDDLKKNYLIVNRKNDTTTPIVDHPKHYNREGAMECIDEMVMLFGAEEVQIFCKLNAWKYRYRAADKGGTEDLEKSDWYLKKYKELSVPF